MQTRETIVQQLKEHHPYLTSEYGVQRIGLFGSFAAGTANEASDIDVLVEFQYPVGFKFIELVDYLEQLFGRKVDVPRTRNCAGIPAGGALLAGSRGCELRGMDYTMALVHIGGFSVIKPFGADKLSDGM